MAKLVLSFNGDVVKEYELDKEILTIGRKPDNDIHIDNLAVSGMEIDGDFEDETADGWQLDGFTRSAGSHDLLVQRSQRLGNTLGLTQELDPVGPGLVRKSKDLLGHGQKSKGRHLAG